MTRAARDQSDQASLSPAWFKYAICITSMVIWILDEIKRPLGRCFESFSKLTVAGSFASNASRPTQRTCSGQQVNTPARVYLSEDFSYRFGALASCVICFRRKHSGTPTLPVRGGRADRLPVQFRRCKSGLRHQPCHCHGGNAKCGPKIVCHKAMQTQRSER